jgi:3-deoxy-7-phosphoheptulonate synthase
MLAAAAAAGADGFMVEVHPSPSSSVSDPKQALTPQDFCTALDTTRAVLHAIGRSLNTVQAATHIL